MTTDWTARRILKELCDADRRRQVLQIFWKEADAETRELVVAALAKNMNFRLDSIRKAPAARKAELLGMQMHIAQVGVAGLVAQQQFPDAAQVSKSTATLKKRFPPADIALYLATAGLLMGRDEPKWREATWPEVAKLIA